jgi:hypothetical protein
MDKLISFFSICISFIISCLIALARISSTLLNKSSNSGHSFLISNFIGNAFGFLPFRIMLAISQSYIAFIMLSYDPSLPIFFRAFFHEGMLNFGKGIFSAY